MFTKSMQALADLKDQKWNPGTWDRALTWRPVVSCRLGTGVDWVNQDGVTGIVVTPRDAEALAGAVNRLLADPFMRAAMGEAGRHRVEREFSMESMVRRMLALYREVCDEPVAARAAA